MSKESRQAIGSGSPSWVDRSNASEAPFSQNLELPRAGIAVDDNADSQIVTFAGAVAVAVDGRHN